MSLCNTCKWWEPNEPIDHPEMVGEDGSTIYDAANDWATTPAPGKWGWCKKVAEFGPRSGSDKFYVIDGSTYRAALNTREDFGCIEHEETA